MPENIVSTTKILHIDQDPPYALKRTRSGVTPYGICTDALSHILVCDDQTKTVQMIDRDGQFMSILLTKSELIGKPCSLSYDVNTYSLWVGSYNNKVYVYRYIGKEDALTSKSGSL